MKHQLDGRDTELKYLKFQMIGKKKQIPKRLNIYKQNMAVLNQLFLIFHDRDLTSDGERDCIVT